MREHSNEFKMQLRSLGKQQAVEITYGSTTLTSEDINEVTYSYEGNLLKSVMQGLEIDSNVNIPVGTEIEFKWGLLVNDEYEYLDYGIFIVKESEKQEDTDSYLLTCYDRMLNSMKDYEPVTSAYPLTLKQYLEELCNKINIPCQVDHFANDSKMVKSDLFEGLGYTYRDVLDQIAEASGSVICINTYGNLEIRYPSETDDEVDEEYLKDTNVNFGEVYGVINSVVLSRGESDNVFLQDDESVKTNGICEIKITDNQFMNFNDRSDYLPELLEKLDGIAYSINDFSSNGIMYYELLDYYTVRIGDKSYKCLMLNDEQNITQGLEEQIYTKEPEKSETDYKKADKTDRKINQTTLIVDKQNQTIEALTTQVDEYEDKLVQVTQTVDDLTSKVEKAVTLTRDITGIKQVTLENCIEGYLLHMTIYGNNTVFKHLYPSNTLTPNDLLYPEGDAIIQVIDEQGAVSEYDLGIDEVLRDNGEVRDTLEFDYGQIIITRRVSKTGATLTEPIITKLPYVDISLKKGINIVKIKNYTATVTLTYAIQSDYSEVFATKVNLTTSINQSAEAITLNVNKTLEKYSTTENMQSEIKQTAEGITSTVSKEIEKLDGEKVDNEKIISTINQSAEAVQIDANKISLNGKTIALTGDNINISSNNFNVDKDGNLTCNNATMNNATMNNATIQGGTVRVQGGSDTGDSSGLKICAADEWYTYRYGGIAPRFFCCKR